MPRPSATAVLANYTGGGVDDCNNFVFNLTSSYADQRNESAMVATTVIMFALATLFFNLNLFSRLSDISAILNPSVRLFLSTSLSLFLPVMSYLFSEAKNESASTDSMRPDTELSLRARTILMWMLLVELLRKKVEAILVSAGVPGYSGTIERAARIAWLGYLVFHNIRSAGKKELYGALWVLAAAKLVQRFVSLELGKRSSAYGKNPQLIASYMEKILEQPTNINSSGSDLLEQCNYVVMGEEDLEKKAGPRGYRLEPTEELLKSIGSTVVTVGKIWTADKEILQKDPRLKDPRLKRLCLSFALYKLLRRRLEDFPITALEAQDCRRIIFHGLCKEGDAAVALFQVLNDEVQFLCECYHAVQPVVFSSPFFFLVNYILFPIVVWAFCVLTAILSGNGDVLYAFRSFKMDNKHILIPRCIFNGRTFKSAVGLLTGVVDILITILLFLAFVYEEVWEFIVFSLSNWFLVSLLCSYTYTTSKQPSKQGWFLSCVIRVILRVRNMMSHPSVRLKHFSVMWLCRLSWAPTTRAVPTEAKEAIKKRLEDAINNKPLSNGRSSTLLLQSEPGSELSRACNSDSIAEVILTWHIATVALEKKKPTGSVDREVATALSGYCAYLVAFHPELLPDEKDGTERVYKDTMAELKKKMGFWAYYCSPQGVRIEKLTKIFPKNDDTASASVPPKNDDMASASASVPPKYEASVLRKGARLGEVLIEKAARDQKRVWELLAELWTEIMVYAAPAAGERHVKAHKEALARGGEFITLLWALATHTGITRPGEAPAGSV